MSREEFERRKYYGGMSRDQREQFEEEEEVRLAGGVPSIDVLDLTTRAYNAWKRTGIKTINGLGLALQMDVVPWRLGPKSLIVTVESYNRYIRSQGSESGLEQFARSNVSGLIRRKSNVRLR